MDWGGPDFVRAAIPPESSMGTPDLPLVLGLACADHGKMPNFIDRFPKASWRRMTS